LLRRRVAGRMEGKLTAIVSPSEMTEIVCARTCALPSKETDRQTDRQTDRNTWSKFENINAVMGTINF
jgi:hypothetical protein